MDDPADGMAAVAARIHERAVRVQTERVALQQTEQEWHELQVRHAEETQHARRVRQEYLQSSLELHTLELEDCRVQDQLDERQSQTRALQQETDANVRRLEVEQNEWESKVLVHLARHKVRQELFQKHLRGAIEAHHHATMKRQELLEKMKRMIQRSEQDRQDTLKEQQRVQAAMMQMTEAEHDINQHVDALALQVREALGKRTELRAILRQAQQQYQDCHNEAENLAHEYRNMNF